MLLRDVVNMDSSNDVVIRKCPNCGKDNEDSFIYCVYCGKRLYYDKSIYTFFKLIFMFFSFLGLLLLLFFVVFTVFHFFV